MKLLDRTTDAPVQAAIETITPALAKRMLANNESNRNIDKKVVSRYGRDMRDGNWLLTGETICLDKYGNVRDGQHRLCACVAANTAFQTLVVRGVESSSQLAMDSGKKRSLSDQLKLLGYSNTADLGTAVHFCWAYDNNRVHGGSGIPSRAEAIRWLEENAGISESLSVGKRISAQLPVRRTVATAVHYLTARVDQQDADDFFARLLAGTNLDEGDPILAFRRWMDRWAGKRDQPASRIHAHALLKCCNYYRSGKQIAFVKVLPSEEFPRVWGEV